MYPALLGKFDVPPGVEDWPLHIVYTPEPPIVIRGAMNPWADERKREVYLAEEAAWKKIPPMQARYRQLKAEEKGLMDQIQAGIREIEGITGKKSGLGNAANYAALAYSISGGPYAWAVTLAKFGVETIIGIFKAKKKKKKIEAIVRRLEALGAQVGVIQKKLAVVSTDIGAQIKMGEGVRAAQPARITAAMQFTEEAYAKRQSLDTLRGNVLRERARQVATMPRLQPGGSNEL